MDFDLALPYLTKDLSGIGGKIRKEIDDFVVEEIPLYEPTGIGEHFYINLTKEGFTTKEVQKRLAEIFNVSANSVSFAGMKDKNARTSQTFSVHLGNNYDNLEEPISNLEKENGLKINWSKFHKNKLRIGHLLGNKFKIRITELEVPLDEALEKAEKIVEKIKEGGIPNFFGSQRFGIDGKNVEKGYSILTGEKRRFNKWEKRFFVSSFQSYLCNIYLMKRLETGNFSRIMKGDVAKKHETGGLFTVENESEEQKRYENHEISFTAPIYGMKMWDAVEESGDFEKKVLEETGFSFEIFKRSKVSGTRRLGRILVPDIVVEKEGRNILLSFSLPKGAFATTVLREIMKNGS